MTRDSTQSMIPEISKIVSKVLAFPVYVNPKMNPAKVRTPRIIYPIINVFPAALFTACPKNIPTAIKPSIFIMFSAMLKPLEEKNSAPISLLVNIEMKRNKMEMNATILMKR